MINKTAGGFFTSMGSVGSTAGSMAADLGSTACVYLIALGALTGTGVGYVSAQMSAKSDTDIDTAKKEYENERLKADLGYVESRMRNEYNKANRKTDVNAARIII